MAWTTTAYTQVEEIVNRAVCEIYSESTIIVLFTQEVT